MTTAANENGTALAVRDNAALMERAVIQGNLTELSPAERVDYYRRVCESLHLNPYTKPFAYLELDDGRGGTKLELYARKDCTEQLRDRRKVSITKLEKEWTPDLYIVTAYAVLPDGRTDSAVGAVPISKESGSWQDVTDKQGRPVINDKTGQPKRRFVADGTSTRITGDALANAIMRAETKAKRRVTLSICGLGITDESEIESIPGARVVEAEYPPAEPEPPEMVTSADSRIWQRWLKVKGEAEGLGIRVSELRLPIAKAELAERGQRVFEGIEARKQQLAAEDADRAAGQTARENRAADASPATAAPEGPGEDPPSSSPGRPSRPDLWKRNRELCDRVAELKLTGVPTVPQASSDDVIADANRTLEERLNNYLLDQQAARASQVAF